MLVNFQPEAMPRAVEESHASASAHLRCKTALGEKFLDRLVNRHSIDSRLDSLQSQRLTGFHRLPKLSLGLGGASAQNRSGHVAKISGLRIARKNIEDNQRVCVKRPVASFMRITRLVAAGRSEERRGGEEWISR